MAAIDQSLKEEISRHKWYQSIPITDDFVTPGETGDAEARKLKMMNLPENLSGKTILDIGCNEGFFSFEVESRGAARVVAVDKSSAAQEKLHLIKRIRNSKVEFMATDLLELKPSTIGQFDIVFFLSVFHHLRYPFQSLDRVFGLTRELAIMEFVEAVPDQFSEQSALVRKLSKKGHLHMLPTRNFTLEIVERAGFSRIVILGTHRAHEVGEDRRMPGFSEQRTLFSAYR